VELRTLAIALLASLVLWNLPRGGVVLYPFKLLATWLHECSHGVAMIVTGAGLERVAIYADTSGLAYPAGSAQSAFGHALIAAAGYMGTPLWGALLLVIARTPARARAALLVLAALLAVTALTVLSTPFACASIGAIAAGLAAVALVVPGRWRLLVAHFVAAQACVNAVLDVRVLFRPIQVIDGIPVGTSDATNMARATFGTMDRWAVMFWAIAWLAWSLAIFYVALRIRTRGQQAAEERAGLAGDELEGDEPDADGGRAEAAPREHDA
jgi:hypothetical protein